MPTPSDPLRDALERLRDHAVIPPEYEDYYLVRRGDYDSLSAFISGEGAAQPAPTGDTANVTPPDRVRALAALVPQPEAPTRADAVDAVLEVLTNEGWVADPDATDYNLRVAGLVVRAAIGEAPTLDAARPEIVVLCGSTRFYDMFQAANYDLTMLGKIVLSVGFYPHSKALHGHGEGVGHDSTEKVALDELHKRKIDLADRVYVLNVDGYIGDSTRSEIDYAIAHGKPVDYLEEPAARLRETP